ncbi:MAG: hypothetical protein K8I82_08775 [Anaerolineae bacterium]|jgi:hypothetical protein|nr:hypothetical protein [Anaerolineae bacterium]
MTSNHHQYINQQLAQLGILISTLGGVLCLIGLYPGITGVEPRSGIGVLQIMIIIFGMTLIIIGAMLFVKIGFYPSTSTNLAQRIAIRLSLTGLLFSLAAGMADLLGYGSNPPEGPTNIPVLGSYQIIGMVTGFVIASFGVLLFALRGPHPE